MSHIETRMIDHTTLDLFVVDDDTCQTFRPRMVSFTDPYTRFMTYIFIERIDASVRSHPENKLNG